MTSPDLPVGSADIVRIFTAAKAAGGARYRLNSPGQATNWKQRAYKFRRQLLRVKQSTMPPGVLATTEWDDVVLMKDPADPNVILITFGTIQGQLTTMDGDQLSTPDGHVKMATAVSHSEPVADSADPLLAEALELAKGLEK